MACVKEMGGQYTFVIAALLVEPKMVERNDEAFAAVAVVKLNVKLVDHSVDLIAVATSYLTVQCDPHAECQHG